MNFCFVYKEDYPWDVRVEKIINTLAEKGHKVDLVCKNINQNSTTEETNNFTIYRLPKTKKIPPFLTSIVNAPLWLNPFWLFLIAKTVIREKSDVIIIRDLPLMLSGIIIAKLFNRKIIFDMAECYPEMYRSAMEHDRTSIVNKIVKNPYAASIYEYLCAKLSSHIWVMVEESQTRLINKGIKPEKISIVSNTPILSGLTSNSKQHAGEKLNIVYVGFLTKIRGIDLLVKSVAKFVASTDGGRDITVDIIGKGSAKNEIEALVIQLELSDYIKVHGWLDHSEVKTIMANANVGALTYRFCGHWNHTIPNKIFDYMAAGLPVLSTNVVPIARILDSVGCGLTTQGSSVDEIATNLIKLKNPQLRNELGAKGQAAIKERYNWDIDSSSMLASIDSIFSTK